MSYQQPIFREPFEPIRLACKSGALTDEDIAKLMRRPHSWMVVANDPPIEITYRQWYEPIEDEL